MATSERTYIMKADSLSGVSDEELMDQYRLGNSHAFDELYHRHAGKVHGYLRKRLGEAQAADACQEVFFKLHRNRGRYGNELPFLPWLFTITHHTCVDLTRKLQANTEDHFDMDALPAFAPADGALVDNVIGEGARVLSLQEKEVLSLHFRDGFAFDEIARRLRLSSSGARKVSSRAVQKLRELFTTR